MSWNITPASEKDRDFFIHVHHTAYRDVIEKMFGWDKVFQDNQANKAFDGGDINIILFNNVKAGVFGLEELSDYFWLKEIFLLPEFQNQGIGSEIINDVISKAKIAKKPLKLRTLKENLNAKKLYERLGFVISNTTDIHWNMTLK